MAKNNRTFDNFDTALNVEPPAGQKLPKIDQADLPADWNKDPLGVLPKQNTGKGYGPTGE